MGGEERKKENYLKLASVGERLRNNAPHLNK